MTALGLCCASASAATQSSPSTVRRRRYHGLFQGYYCFGVLRRRPNERDAYADHPYYEATVRFCAEWDHNCFDPKYHAEPLAHFEPMVREIFARPPKDIFSPALR